ncbi:condensin-2 complex subunit D3 [Planoprotostelium fungivorum]|nr:condensin-2 complex subunit D3 [Planoprotostelium fungivorum]
MPKKTKASDNEDEQLQTIRQKIRDFGVLGISDDLLERAWLDECTDDDSLAVTPPPFKELKEFILSIESLEDPQQLWPFLTEEDVTVRHFLVWIKLLLSQYRGSTDHNTAVISVETAHLYATLLSMEGSQSFNLFQPLVFQSVLKVLRAWKLVQVTQNSREIDEAKKAKRRGGVKATNPAKRTKSSKKATLLEDDEQEAEETDSAAPSSQTSQSNLSLLGVSSDQVIQTIECIVKALRTNSLAGHNECREQAVEAFSELTRYYPSEGEQSKKKKHRDNREDVTGAAFEVLRELIDERHGGGEGSTTMVLKNILPNILMTHAGLLVSGSVPKHMQNIRNSAISFVIECIKAKEKTHREAVHALIQHICVQVPDKAEYRGHAVSAVTEIYHSLPPQDQTRFVSFVQRFGKNAKSNLRIFAVDLSFALLSEEGLEKEEEREEGEEMQVEREDDNDLRLIELLLQRSSDKIATVRAKAISNVAHLLERATQDNKTKRKISGLLSGSENSQTELHKLLRKRVQDEKCGVRKSALQGLEMVARLSDMDTFTHKGGDLDHFAAKSRDPALSIRRQALDSLSSLFRDYPHVPDVYSTWLRYALPLITDVETSVQDKVLDYAQELLLSPMMSGDASSPVWPAAALLSETEIYRPFQRVILALGKQKRLEKKLYNQLLKNLKQESHVRASWVVLNEIAPFNPSYLEPSLIFSCWDDIKESEAEDTVGTQQKILNVMQCCRNVEAGEIERISQGLLERLKRFDLPPSLIQSYVTTLSRIFNLNQGKKLLKERCQEILAICDEQLSAYILPHGDRSSRDEKMIMRYLFTMGEVSQTCHLQVSSRLVTVVQAIISPTTHVVGVEGEVKPIPNSVRGSAFVALGKLCLENEQLAKRIIPALAKEVETSDNPVIRNNAMVVMCDLCIKYTALVDNYVVVLALCLRDSNELVRKQTLMSLTTLLQEDFVKWKGIFFYRFVVAMVDESEDIRTTAHFCLVSLLKGKNPQMFSGHFMELIFHLNNYKQHPTYNQFIQTEKEREAFSLEGEVNAEKRMEIYRVFLNHMDETQRFLMTAKICTEILAALTDGMLSYVDSQDILMDALAILSSKEIRIQVKSKAVVDNEEEEQVQAAREKLLSKIIKKNVLENIVPIVIEMKRFLEKHHSPLLKNLMQYIANIMKDFKSEVEDIFVADKQLAQEIEYDLKQMSLNETEKKGRDKEDIRKKIPASPAVKSVIEEGRRASMAGRDVTDFAVPKVKTGATPTPKKGLPSPYGRGVSTPLTPSSRKWQVDLEPVVPLVLEDDEEEKENRSVRQPVKEEKKVKTVKKKMVESSEEEEEATPSPPPRKRATRARQTGK